VRRGTRIVAAVVAAAATARKLDRPQTILPVREEFCAPCVIEALRKVGKARPPDRVNSRIETTLDLALSLLVPGHGLRIWRQKHLTDDGGKRFGTGRGP